MEGLGSGFFLGGRVGAGRFVHAGGAFVFLADFFDQATGDEVLEFFVGAKAEHFLAAADGVAKLEVVEHALEEIIETKHLLFSENDAKLVGDMIGKAAGEPGTFRGGCHNAAKVAP